MQFLDAGINIVFVLAILVILVVIHELGHFVTARLAHVRVHEFGIGFPPRARVLGRDHETVYTLNWLPIGGFVRLEGEEGDSSDPRSFVRQRLPVRLVILLAGVVMNFLLAWLIFTVIAGFADPSAGARIRNVPADSTSPSPAQAAGLVGGRQIGTYPNGVANFDDSGDLITAVDGHLFSWFDSPNGLPDGVTRYLRAHSGQQVTITVRHATGTVEDKIVRLRTPDEAKGKGALGIEVRDFPIGENLHWSPVEAVGVGLNRTLDACTLILRAFRDLAGNLSNPQVSGPVGIVQTVGIVRNELPPVFILYLIGALSANLAIVNVLPIPPMDGGRIAVSLVQAISGNRVSVAVERATYLAGFVLLFSFLIWVTFFDLQRAFGGGT